MSDYYWQRSLPTARHIDYVTQVKYTVHPATTEFFQVKQTNLHGNVTLHRVYLPQYYYWHVVKFFWKLYLVIRLYQTFRRRKAKKFKSFMPTLLRIMIHLDNVIESLIRPAINVDRQHLGAHRSANFNEYLITEFLLGRHDPVTVNEFRSKYPKNIERMALEDFDWAAYESRRIDPKLLGEEYLYDVDNIPRDHMEELWDLVKQHYNRPLDSAWLSTWVDWDDGDSDREDNHDRNLDLSDGEGDFDRG